VWEGDGVVAAGRKLVGATNPLNAEPGTIRGDFARVSGRNIVHASDSPENGERETALWFGDAALLDWTPSNTPWIIE
jgi:nucleoside-diphosphate kinase